LNQEEEVVQLVPEECKELKVVEEADPCELPALSRKLFQVTVFVAACNLSE
jgi:hypothetical protein